MIQRLSQYKDFFIVASPNNIKSLGQNGIFLRFFVNFAT